MTIDRQTMQCFGLLLILLTIAGFIISFIAIHILDGRRLGHIGEATIIGTVVGFMQWIALRRVIKIEISWVLANIIGFLVFSGLHTHYGWQLSAAEEGDIPLYVLNITILFAGSGALSGIMQQLILRRHSTSSWWWVLASAGGWGLSMAGMEITYWSFLAMERIPYIVFLIGFWLGPVLVPSVILSVITAATMIWLMRQPKQQMLDTAAQK
jgi:hypothetical protein